VGWLELGPDLRSVHIRWDQSVHAGATTDIWKLNIANDQQSFGRYCAPSSWHFHRRR
jgi:hypothetical protein